MTNSFNTSSYGSLNGMKFSSCNQDNDLHASRNCGLHYGGFWYNSCSAVEINDYPNENSILLLNDPWHVKGLVEMKVRPKDCNTD